MSRRQDTAAQEGRSVPLLRVNTLTQTCRMCPSQWDGTTEDGRRVYVRYRWGCLDVYAGNAPGDDPLDGDPLIDMELGDGLDGVLTFAELVDATHGLVQWPDAMEAGR